MKKTFILSMLTCFCICSFAQSWNNVDVPADASIGQIWLLQSNVSDDFSYNSSASTQYKEFGDKWYNYFHNGFEGPGPTKWVRENVSVTYTNNQGDLVLRATRKAGETKTYSTGIANPATDTKPVSRAGCVTSLKKVKYPVFVEGKIKVANAVMASDIWLLSPDDTQEIDIIEAYGGKGSDNRNPFAKNIHLSHHTFDRRFLPNMLYDYQPGDFNSWYVKNGIDSWGVHCKTNYVRVGVYWKSPTHLEYYIDGEKVRTLSDDAFASLRNGNWEYTYPAGTNNGQLIKDQYGYQKVNTASSLSQAQSRSTTSVIDPFGYTAIKQNLPNEQYEPGKDGLYKEMDIIINMEDQNWNAYQGRTPTNDEINNNPADHTMKVDWIRAYKPVNDVQAEMFGETGGTFVDGLPNPGVKRNATAISHFNKGDWVTYDIYVPQNGAYRVKYTAAIPSAGSKIAFSVSGIDFSEKSIPATGSYNTYQTIDAGTINLTEGHHQIKLTAKGNNWGPNLDKIFIKREGPLLRSAQLSKEVESNFASLSFFVDSKNQKINITGAEENSTLSIFDIQGKLIKTFTDFENNSTVNINDLNSGIYVAKLQSGNTFKALKFKK